MKSARYLFLLAFLMLSIFAPIMLFGQGYEKDILVSGNNIFSRVYHEPLPDNGLIFGVDSVFLLLDAESTTLFSRSLPEGRQISGLTTSASGDTLIVYSVVKELDELVAYTHYYNVVGELLVTNEVALPLESFLETYTKFASRTFPTTDGGSVVIYTVIEPEFDIPVMPEIATKAYVVKLDDQGVILDVNTFSIAEFFRLQEVDLLADGSLAAMIAQDTVFDGNVELFQSVAALYHFIPGDTLLQLSPYFFDVDGDVGMSNTGSDNYSVSFHPNNQDSRFLVYDFSTDTLITDLEVETPNAVSGSALNVLEDNEGGYYLKEANEDFFSPLDAGAQVRQVNAQGEILNSFFTSGSFGDFIGIDVFGYKANGNLYGAAFDAGRMPESPGKFYRYFELDESLQSFTNLLQGTVYTATDDINCIPDTNQSGVANWWVIAQPDIPGLDTLYGYTTADGSYRISCDSATYHLIAIPPNAYFSSCNQPVVTTAGSYDTITTDLVAVVEYDCPLLSVSLSATPLHECDAGYYAISYRNNGATSEAEPIVVIDLDTSFVTTGSSPPWTERIGNQLIFELDPLGVNESGFIYVYGNLDCSIALPGKTHCTQARILPDTFCTPINPLWDGSSIEVSGSCVGDSVNFTIQNVGADMSAPLDYIVIEEFVIHLGGTFELPSEATFDINFSPEDGASYWIQTEQAQFHPGSNMPSAGVEGCGNFDLDQFVLGLNSQFQQNEGDPFVAIHCVPSVAGEDLEGFSSGSQENESRANEQEVYLLASPGGIGAENYVDTATVIEYTVAFRDLMQVDNDGIYRVNLKGHLPPEFEVSSLIPGAASHPYDFSVNSLGGFSFVVESPDDQPILMPPAFRGWSGFIQFSAKLRSDLPYGSQVCFQPELNINHRVASLTNERCLTVRKPQRYAINSEFFCIPGQDTVIETRFIDSLSYNSYDSLILTIVTEAASYSVDDFRTVAIGDTIAGTVVSGNIILQDTIMTDAGCDSIVTYYIIATSVYETAKDVGVVVFPNPLRDRLSFKILESTKQETLQDLLLFDLNGHRYMLAPDNSGLILSGETYHFDVSHIPPGIYVLTGGNGGNRWFQRLIIQ